MSDIIFIVQQLSQPRCLKRIHNFLDAGYKCRVFGFNNGLYEDNFIQAGFEAEEVRSIRKNDGKFSKVIQYFKFIKSVLHTVKEGDVVYAFGFEIGTVVSFLYGGRFIYEEADISASRAKLSPFRAFLVYLDKRIIRKSQLTIFTSEGFQDYLFPYENPFAQKILFIHNKLHDSFRFETRTQSKELNVSSIDFGFVGLIRYPDSILRFARVIGQYFPQHRFHFWGEAEGNILHSVDWSLYSNVYFHGGFRNPDDLINIYSTFDINVCCYDPTSENVRIAEPNKLYESIFFGKPLVVSLGTFLQKRVESLGIGFAINSLSDHAICSFIGKLTVDALLACQRNCIKVPSVDVINDPKGDMELIGEYLT